IDHTKRAGNDAVAATVAHVILHENRTDLGAHDRAGWARFEAAGLFAMLADVGEKDPAEWILAIATAERMGADDLISFLTIFFDKHHVPPGGSAEVAGVVVRIT